MGATVNAVISGRRGDAEADAEESGVGGADTAGDDAEESRARLTEAAERFHAERERLQRERRELETARRELNERRRRADVDASELRRENCALARRVRWYQKPVWERVFLRALGRDAPDDAGT